MCDSRRLIAEGVASLMPDGTTIAFSRAVCSLDALVDSFASVAADVVVLGGPVPAERLLDMVHEMRERGVRAPVLLLADAPCPGTGWRALREGVVGVLSPIGATQRTLRAAAVAAAEGRGCLAAAATAHEKRYAENPLKDGEIHVLRLAARGMSSREIASTVHFARGTVRNYLSAAIRKVGARNRIEAGRLAAERGWV